MTLTFMRLGHLGQMHLLDFRASGVQFFTRLQGGVNHISASSAPPNPIPSRKLSASAIRKQQIANLEGREPALPQAQPRVHPVTPFPPTAHNTHFGDENTEVPGGQGTAGEGSGHTGNPICEFGGNPLPPVSCGATWSSASQIRGFT